MGEQVGQDEAAKIFALVRDLMFASKISAAAKAGGVSVRMLREPLQLMTVEGDLLIVDLNQAGALDAAAAWKTRTGGAVVGFVSHVDAETIAKARELGIDQILARSAFVMQLPQLLASQS